MGSPASICGTSGAQDTTSSRPRDRADSPSTPATCSTTSRTSKSRISSSRRPASILEKSRMSLSTPSSARLATCTPVARRCWSWSRVVRISRSLSPMTPLSGVRISWLIVARKSDFIREASMAASRACSSSAAVCSRQATNAIWAATWSTICSIMAWRKSGGAEVIVMTARTSPPSTTGNAMVRRASSQVGSRLARTLRASRSSAASRRGSGCSPVTTIGTRSPSSTQKPRARSQSSWSSTRSRARSSSSSRLDAAFAALATACIKVFCATWSSRAKRVSCTSLTSCSVPDISSRPSRSTCTTPRPRVHIHCSCAWTRTMTSKVPCSAMAASTCDSTSAWSSGWTCPRNRS